MQELLKHFHELSLHPKNAKELKGLILQLAIQGNLTSDWRRKNPDNKADQKLLDRIKDFNKKRLKEKKRRVKILKVDEQISVEIPTSWLSVYNYSLFTLQKGKNPKDLSEQVKNYPYLDIKALDRDLIRRYSDDKKAVQCTENDILVVCDGSRSGLVLNGKNGVVGSTLAIIETPPFIQEYIKLIFLEDFQRANSNMKGAAIPHLDIKALLTRKVGLPPLEEQKEIVKVVEILFKEVEALESLTEKRIELKKDYATSALSQLAKNDSNKEWQAIKPNFHEFFTEVDNIKKLRETILQLAVQGKLTSKWRRENPELISGENSAEKLLDKIKAEKAELIKTKKIKKEKPLPPITDDEISYVLPGSWVWTRMIDICQYITDGTHQTPRYTEKGRMFLSAKNVKPFKFMPEEHRFVSEEDFEGYRRNRKPEMNDILLTRVGAGIGEATLIDQDLEFAIYVSVGLLKMFPDLIEPNYLVIWLNSPEGRNYSSRNTYGKGVSQGNLNLSLIRGFVVSLPPLSEQKIIVEKVNSFMGLCDQLEKEVEIGQKQIEDLMQSVLKEVFEGEKELEETYNY